MDLPIAGAILLILLLSFWILWKTRKVIWFLFLFILAFLVLCGIQLGWEEYLNQNKGFALFIIIGGAAFTAYKFAKKRSL